VEDQSKKITLEYSKQGNTVVITTRRPGQPPVRIVADTVPPKAEKEDAA
jgi:hypothetical protein